MPVLLTPNKKYAAGVTTLTDTQVIPRLRPTLAIPPGYLTTNKFVSAGRVYGADKDGTAVRFTKEVQRAYFMTELYATGKVSKYWNDNNSLGDTTLRHVLNPSINNLTIIGAAELRSYPYGRPSWIPEGEPDPHGVDFQWIADGIASEATGAEYSFLDMFQIPGTAIILRRGGGANAGMFGPKENKCINQAHNCFISQAMNGVHVDQSSIDAKLHDLWITNMVKDGIHIYCGVVRGCHVWGADRSAVSMWPTRWYDNYLEAARIGFYVGPQAGGTTSHGHDIGPGTCWQHAILMDGRTHITGLTGRAGINAVGVEFNYGAPGSTVEGELDLSGGSTGVLCKTRECVVDLHVNAVQPATVVKVLPTPNPPWNNLQQNGLNVIIRGYTPGGTLLDLSQSELDKPHRNGEKYFNTFLLKAGKSPMPVLYPGYGTPDNPTNKYNLYEGNKVEIRGQLQS